MWSPASLAAQQLGYALEMLVTGDQYQVMLQHECGDPEVVVGNGRARALQLNEQPGVMLRRLPAREQDPNGVLGEQLSQ